MEYPLNRPSACVVLGIDKKEVFIVGSEGSFLHPVRILAMWPR